MREKSDFVPQLWLLLRRPPRFQKFVTRPTNVNMTSQQPWLKR